MPKFFFQRYVHGERMADDVLITQQPTLEDAIPAALQLCRNSPMSVLVHLPDHSELREEIARLREALKPFGKMAVELDDGWDDGDCHWVDCHQFEEVPTVGDLRRARAASERKEG